MANQAGSKADTRSPAPVELDRLLAVAVEAAQVGGRATLEWFGSNVVVETKADNSPVTIADRTAEQRIVEVIRKAFPDHSVLGEEHGELLGTQPVQWIIDPIDGTKTFISGVPLYGTMVAALVDGEPVVGVVNIPALGELYAAARGRGATCNGRPIRVSSCDRIEDARVMCTDLRRLETLVPDIERWKRFERGARLVRTWGDCYGHMLVASGRAEIMIDPKMAVWDNAALVPIITEAGGHFTGWNGVATVHATNAVSTNGHLHAAASAALAGADGPGDLAG